VTRDQAIAIRTRQLQGVAINPSIVAAAIAVIKGPEPGTGRTARTTPFEREAAKAARADLVLIRRLEAALAETPKGEVPA
jgi:hypothetical protein